MQPESNSFYTHDFENPFRSFWMAGFECSDQLNAFGNRVDFLELTAHLDLIQEDYVRINSLNLKSAREGIRWSVVEPRPYQYNFDQVAVMIRAGKENRIQQIWDVCHFGYPDDLSPFHPHFLSRFVALCEAFVTFLLENIADEPLIITPINEVSFISWLGGEVGGTTPYCVRNGWDLKYA
ncbi:MAG TPA: amine oxidase, partial [Dyadobacter sp.]|nr:amine oxidase [Dyadobacter sp.]